MADQIQVSLIVPTRGRPDQLLGFIGSVARTVSNPSAVEIVCVVDTDDLTTVSLPVECSVRVQKVFVQPGLRMGELNSAGFGASSGRFVMLMNDDVIVKTPSWDERVGEIFRSFPDGIVLVHTEDGIFHEKLCTFPLVSRAFCEMIGGVSPDGYRRYRIDDHIFNLFNLLAVLGHKRVVYCPDLVFEHQNFTLGEQGEAVYVPNPEIHREDTLLFDQLFEERKAQAVRLAEHIDRHRRQEVSNVRARVLAPLHDAVALRRPEYVRRFTHARPDSSDTRVTVGVVSANIESDFARHCIQTLKKYTTNFDLIVLDNNRGGEFNHPREMNRILSICRTDYLVLMDDDVWVTEGWLEGLLKAIGPSVGVVTPLHLAKNGSLSYAGIAMRPDASGHHSHVFKVPASASPTQSLCSAVMLIDMTKVGHVRVDESYSKYFLDIDYGLRIWEAGFQVVVAPESVCTHIGGATLAHSSALAGELFDVQRRHWVAEWIHTGRYDRLAGAAWQTVPSIQGLFALTQQLHSLLEREPDESIDSYIERSLPHMAEAQSIPTLLHYLEGRIVRAVNGQFVGAYDKLHGHLMVLFGLCGAPTLLNVDWCGRDIYVSGLCFYAVPTGTPTPSREFLASSHPPLVAASLSLAKLRESLVSGETIDDRIRHEPAPVVTTAPPEEPRQLIVSAPPAQHQYGGELVLEGYLGYNVVRYGIYYGVRQVDGAFSIDKVKVGAYRGLVPGDSLESVQRTLRRSLRVNLSYHMGRIARYLARRSRGERAQQAADDRIFSDGQVATIRDDIIVAGAGETSSGSRSVTRTASASEIVKLSSNHRGFDIFRYEHKFFCVPTQDLSPHGVFDYPRFARRQYGVQFLGHSLSEAHALIDLHLSQHVGPESSPLLLADMPRAEVEALTKNAGISIDACTVVCPSSAVDEWRDHQIIECRTTSLAQWESVELSVPERLPKGAVPKAIVPWSVPKCWNGSSVERMAARLAPQVELILPNGVVRTYFGENLHRLIYNKAYLSSMFQVVPLPTSSSVLEVGCSDGLVCDLFAALGARSVVGVDVMLTAGCSFPTPGVRYHAMDASRLQFDSNSFDVAFSIATMEHVSEPASVIDEMIRVVKPGGHIYVQAGPLYHSPFGHHMFAYFLDEPWIHLRRSPQEIVEMVKRTDLASRIEADTGQPAEDYIFGMLTPEHINGLLVSTYGLEALRDRSDVEVLKLSYSTEGSDLMTSALRAELSRYSESDLYAHGFEVALRKKR